MKSFLTSLRTMAFAGIILFSCDKKDDDHATPATGTGQLVLEFDNVVGANQLSLDSSGTTFTNGHGEKFSVTQFNYYVSNIRLHKSDGSVYTVPQDSSYFLIQENIPFTQEVRLRNVPAGDYAKVSFTLGIDSLRSTMDLSKRQGVLAPDYLPGHGMYWAWNSGYIFMKLEGISPSAPDSTGKSFMYHIGGFGGYSSKTINNIKNLELSLPTTATVRTTIKPQLHMYVDVLKVFSGTTALKVAENAVTMWGPLSVGIANNYQNMIQVHHVHNDH